MSDWMDLRLAHSLTPVSAPDALWARLSAPPAAQKRVSVVRAVRWIAPVAVAACVMVLMARPVEMARTALQEACSGRVDFASNDPAAVQHWLEHHAGVAAPLRPSAGVQVAGARLVRPGVATVSYRLEGRPMAVLLARGGTPSRCKLPGLTVITAGASAESPDGPCRLCHSL